MLLKIKLKPTSSFLRQTKQRFVYNICFKEIVCLIDLVIFSSETFDTSFNNNKPILSKLTNSNLCTITIYIHLIKHII